MFSKVKKRQCKDRLSFLVMDHKLKLVQSQEKLLNKRKEFDFAASSLLEEYYIDFDDVYDMFDKTWDKIVEIHLSYLNTPDGLLKFSADMPTAFKLSVGLTILNPESKPLVRATIYCYLFNKYLEAVEKQMAEYVDKYEPEDE